MVASKQQRRIDPAVLNDPRFRELYANRWESATFTTFPNWPYNPSYERAFQARRMKRAASHKRKKLLADLIAERGGFCVQCRGTERLSIDHVLPTTWGGTNDLFNLQILCRDCNSGKGNTLPVLDAAETVDIGAFI